MGPAKGRLGGQGKDGLGQLGRGADPLDVGSAAERTAQSPRPGRRGSGVGDLVLSLSLSDGAGNRSFSVLPARALGLGQRRLGVRLGAGLGLLLAQLILGQL